MTLDRRLGFAAVALLVLLLAAAGGQAKEGKTVKKQLNAELDDLDAPEVQLPSLGWITGRWMQTRGGRRIVAFTAVPFAQPPVGELRFKAPVPVEPWTGSRESPPLEQIPVCMQNEANNVGLPPSEDCLYLNVFTPTAVNGSNLPVLVWLHGGAFVEGSSALYGPDYLLDRDLVLVTVNYRLGALGFLSTGDAASAGNWGLKDQHLALQWVRQHIAALGGDPDNVTLVGHSSGAASAHFHLLARSNRGLFQRVVSLSACALSASLPNSGSVARRYAARLAAKVGCPETPSADLVSCLRAKPARDLVAHEAALKDGGICPFITWAPVLEDFAVDSPAFVEHHPVDAITSGLALDVPWMSGININDGGIWAAILEASKQMEVFDANLGTILPLCFGFNDTADPAKLPDIVQEIKEFYFGTNKLTRENLNDLSNLFTDGLFLSSVDEAMRLHAAYSPAPAFLYLFSHSGQRSMTDVIGAGEEGRLGVVHGDELLHLFPLTHLLPARDDPDDRKVFEQLVDLLLNFAKSGHPTPAGDARYALPWKPVESEDLEFMEIGQGGRLLKGAGLLGFRAHFWAALPLSERHEKNMRASMPQWNGRDEF